MKRIKFYSVGLLAVAAIAAACADTEEGTNLETITSDDQTRLMVRADVADNAASNVLDSIQEMEARGEPAEQIQAAHAMVTELQNEAAAFRRGEDPSAPAR
jgi:methylthioribose-1-phosphate isomerase